MATGGDGGGVRGRKRRSPHGLGGHDTILQRLVCPAVYQRETFMFLYDFYMCRASTSPPTSSVQSLRLPSSTDDIATHFMLPAIEGDTNIGDPPTAIPIEQLLEYRYEDDRYETSLELEARMRSFPNCRIIHERLTSFRIMSYERTLKTLTIVMEVAVDVLFRQCRLYLLQDQHDGIAGGGGGGGGGILFTESLRLSYHDVGRMFVGAWRDYVMQSRYGRYHPQKIRLQVHREPVSINVVTYYREKLGIEHISNDDIVLDYYAFQCEEIKKGTNLSRLTQSMQQLELGEHVSPRYVSIFRALYKRLIVDPLQFLRIQSEYTSSVVSPSGDGDGESPKRGRKRRDPDKISQLFAEEKRKRALWYRQQQQQYLQDQQRQEEEENQMLDDILSSLQTPISVSSSTAAVAPSVVVGSTSPSRGGYGQYRKNIENCCSRDDDSTLLPPPSSPPPKRRRRRTKGATMTMMLANIKL